MCSKTLNHLRVVVHINEQDSSEDQNVDSHSTSLKCGIRAGLKRNARGEVIVSPSSDISSLHSFHDNEYDNMKAEILLIDDKSLQLNLISTEEYGPYTSISHKMHFDHITHSNTDMIKYELGTVMDDLLLERKNSCIIRFATKLQSDTPIFFNYLITFINKRIFHQKYKLHYVKLKSLDIAASAQTSKMSHTEKGFVTGVKPAGNGNDKCNKKIYSNDSKRQFRSTRDLLLWLLNQYQSKISANNNDNKRHEKLQFSFSIVDHQQNIFKVKLSLFNIFLNFMNSEDRKHWHYYMDHIGEGCQGLNCDFVHSGLTVSMSNYIEGISSEYTLLLFDVPSNINMTDDTIEMLQIAHTIIKNRRRKLILLSKNVNLDRRLPPSSNERASLSPQLCEGVKNNQDVNAMKVRRSTVPLLTERYSMGVSMCDNIYSNKDFDTLSAWYRRIDECVEKIRQLREKYFSRYFQLKTQQISSNIKNMFKSMESLATQQNERDHNELQENQIELHDLFQSYHDFQAQFHQISEDTKATDFEEILKVYMDTKTFDLNNQAVSLKRKYLELCQQHLNFTFDILSGEIILFQ